MGRVPVWENEKVLEMMVGKAAQQCECTLNATELDLQMVMMINFVICGLPQLNFF